MRPLQSFPAVLWLVSAMLLSGCSTAPAAPEFQLRYGERVGLLVQTGDTPGHVHDGETQETSFSRRYAVSWNLDTIVTDTISSRLSEAGFTVVDLESQGYRYEDVAGLVQAQGRQWTASVDKAPVAERLRQAGIRTVVVLREGAVPAARDCTDNRCSDRYVDMPGLYSMEASGVRMYYAVAAFRWNVYLLDPPGDMTAAQPLGATLRKPSVGLTGFETTDVTAMSERDLERVRSTVLRYVSATAADVAKVLGAKRMVRQR